VSFAIANNLITFSTKATDLGISPQTTIVVTWNNSENHEDEFFGMKHHGRCSYTIIESSHKDKWGAMAKAWMNKVLSMTNVHKLIVKTRCRDKV
jgi:hypothetical protein